MSEKAKWTPGKWKAFRKPMYDYDEGHLTRTGTDPDRWVLMSEIEHRPALDGIVMTAIHFAEFFRCGHLSDEELEANVRIAEAAPAMAEALENLLNQVIHWGDDRQLGAIAAEISAAEAAIALAHGETE